MLIYRVTISDKKDDKPFCHFETKKKHEAERYAERAKALRQHVTITQRVTSYEPA
jgi:hypothetical protein